MPALELTVRMGEILTEADVDRWAELLAPVYEREQWKWGPGLRRGAVPTVAIIAETIRVLLYAGPGLPCQTGGLGIQWAAGVPVLYVHAKLAPSGYTKALL